MSTLLCTLVLAGSLPAQIPIYELHEHSLPDVRDGSLDDWMGLVPGPSLVTADFADVMEQAPLPADESVKVYLGWCRSLSRIYVGIERVDDVYVNNYVGSTRLDISTYDSYQIMVDGDRSGGPIKRRGSWPAFATAAEEDAYIEEGRRIENGQAQKYVALSLSGTDRNLEVRGIGDTRQEWATRPPYGDAGGQQWDVGMSRDVCELYVTAWDSLIYHGAGESQISSFHAGAVIGFQMSIIDHDGEDGMWDEWYSIAGAVPSDYLSDRWLEAVLVGHADGPDPSAVSGSTWGTVKSTGGAGASRASTTSVRGL